LLKLPFFLCATLYCPPAHCNTVLLCLEKEKDKSDKVYTNYVLKCQTSFEIL